MIEILAYVIIVYIVVRFADLIATDTKNGFVRVLAGIGIAVVLIGAFLIRQSAADVQDTIVAGAPSPYDFGDTTAITYP
ncbi:MAG: hypothetical protein AB1941_00465 [Gemmatimonadota bacterium]